MNFKDQQFFYYEQELWHGYDLNGLFRDHSQANLLPTTGLADLRETLIIQHEWYHRFPKVSIKELRTTCQDVDKLDFEPDTGKLEFGREIILRPVVREEQPKHNLKASGVNVDQNISLAVGLLQLHQVDYWPRPGDRIFWKGRVYDIITVYAQPEDYYQLSGVPMHLTLNAEITQFSHAYLPERALGSETLYPEPAWYLDLGIPGERVNASLPERGGPHVPHGGGGETAAGILSVFGNAGLLIVEEEEEEEPTPQGETVFEADGEAPQNESVIVPFTNLPSGRFMYALKITAWGSDGTDKGVDVKGTCLLSTEGSRASEGEARSVVGSSPDFPTPQIIIQFVNLACAVTIVNTSEVECYYTVNLALHGTQSAD